MKGRQDHGSIVKNLVECFIDNGFEISYAKYTGYEKPIVIKRHNPDVIARNHDKTLTVIGEAKMCNELTDQITKEQFEDFSSAYIERGSEKIKVQFYIGVPEQCEFKVKESFRLFSLPWKDNIQVWGF